MSEIQPYLPYLLRGLLVTLEVTGLGLAVAIPMAFAAGLGRMSTVAPVRWLAGLFIEVFRGTSAVVQLFWFFYALPLLGLSVTPLSAGVLALGLNQASYAAEIVRGSLVAVPTAQTEAAVALNMGRWMRFWRVSLPQAIPTMLPSFGNVSIDLMKATSLVSLVTVSDLTFRAQTVRSATGATTAIFTLILLWYFVCSVALSLVRRWLERRVSLERPATRERRLRLPRLGPRQEPAR